MNGYYFKPGRALCKLAWTLSLSLGLSGSLLSYAAMAQEEPESLMWARVDFIRNRVQLVPRDESGRRANISDILRFGDALRTARASRAELRFNDGSLARVGERATFRFTPNTRNFQLSNGTILLLIPPGRGRSTISTPNAVTGIQGSALFVRYIPETDTTIVGALTDNPDGPMVLFNEDGSEQQALRANEIGVVEGDQITELYQFDGTLFWQSSGLAEGFNYLSESTSTDELDGVRQEIREAISTQGRLDGDSVITNPEAFQSPDTNINSDLEVNTEDAEIEYQGSPAQEYESSTAPIDEKSIEVGINNNLEPAEEEEVAVNTVDTVSSEGDETTTDNSEAESETSSNTASSEGTESDGSLSDTASSEGTETEAASSEGTESGGAGALGAAALMEGEPAGGNATEGSPGTETAGVAVSETGVSETDTLSENVVDNGLSGAASEDVGVQLPSDDESLNTPVGTPESNPSDQLTTEPATASSSVLPPETTESGSAGAGASPPSVDLQPVDTTSSSEAIGANSSAPVEPVTNVSDVTVPDVDDTTSSIGESPILQPVLDQVDKLDEVQSVHDTAEMHNPSSGASGASGAMPPSGASGAGAAGGGAAPGAAGGGAASGIVPPVP